MYADDAGHVTASRPIRVPQFHGDSYIAVPLRRPASRSLSFEIWFLSYEPNGIITDNTHTHTHTHTRMSNNSKVKVLGP